MFALYIKRFEFRMKFVYFIFNCKTAGEFYRDLYFRILNRGLYAPAG